MFYGIYRNHHEPVLHGVRCLLLCKCTPCIIYHLSMVKIEDHLQRHFNDYMISIIKYRGGAYMGGGALMVFHSIIIIVYYQHMNIRCSKMVT